MYRRQSIVSGYCYYGAKVRYCEVVVSYENISVLYMHEFLYDTDDPTPGVLVVEKIPLLARTPEEVAEDNDDMHIHKWNLHVAVYERLGELYATHPGRYTLPLHEWHTASTINTSRYTKAVVRTILNLNKQL